MCAHQPAASPSAPAQGRYIHVGMCIVSYMRRRNELQLSAPVNYLSGKSEDHLGPSRASRPYQESGSEAGFQQESLSHHLMRRLRLIPGQRPQLRMELPVLRSSPPLYTLLQVNTLYSWSTPHHGCFHGPGTQHSLSDNCSKHRTGVKKH